MVAGRRPDRGRREVRRREEEEYGYSPVCSQGKTLCILMSRMERYVMATAQSAHKVKFFLVF